MATLRRVLLASLFAALLAPGRPAAQASFYDAFQAGKRANASGDFASGVRLLEQAISQHPESGKRVRLYGTNFADDYFPYTELGYAYFKLGQPKRAAEILERALAAGIEPRARIESLLGESRAALTPKEAPVSVPATTATGAPPPPPKTEAAPPAPQPRTSSTVSFQSTPPGALVSLDGKALGRAPLTLDLPADGSHGVRFELAERLPVVRTVVLSPGERLTVTAELLPAAEERPPTPPRETPPATGELELEIRPAGSEVLVDGNSAGAVGEAPLVLPGLTPGDHALQVRRDGFEPKAMKIRVQPGVRVHYQTDLSPLRPSVEPAPSAPPASSKAPLLLALIALVAAAAGAAAMMVRRRREATPSAVVSLPTLDSSASPAAIGGYILKSKIGSGGMADVFRAEDTHSGRTVALKVPLARFCEDGTFATRFLREGQIGRELDHEGIIRIVEAGKAGERLFLAMEFIDGETLKASLARFGKPFPPREAALLVRQVTRVLAYTHSKGVIHRDLKPENIMVERATGHVKVADFGVAKLVDATSFTTTGQVLGTPNYLPPEPFIGEPYGPSSDFYSLGVIFYELLTLQRPFEADTLIETIRRHQTPDRPIPSAAVPGVPPSLDAIVLRMLQIRPADRYSDAEALLADLDGAIARLAPTDETLLLPPGD